MIEESHKKRIEETNKSRDHYNFTFFNEKKEQSQAEIIK
jgi:hypothetical protein